MLGRWRRWPDRLGCRRDGVGKSAREGESDHRGGIRVSKRAARGGKMGEMGCRRRGGKGKLSSTARAEEESGG